jgi:cell division septation protein DedD
VAAGGHQVREARGALPAAAARVQGVPRAAALRGLRQGALLRAARLLQRHGHGAPRVRACLPVCGWLGGSVWVVAYRIGIGLASSSSSSSTHLPLRPSRTPSLCHALPCPALPCPALPCPAFPSAGTRWRTCSTSAGGASPCAPCCSWRTRSWSAWRRCTTATSSTATSSRPTSSSATAPTPTSCTASTSASPSATATRARSSTSPTATADRSQARRATPPSTTTSESVRASVRMDVWASQFCQASRVVLAWALLGPWAVIDRRLRSCMCVGVLSSP